MFKTPLRIMVDVTTRCNAGCPQCHRTDLNGLKAKSWLPDITWNLEQFMTAYPIKTLRHIKNVDFCGTWGDPLTNNNLVEMVDYIIKANDTTTVSINTNGSLRDEKFWWDLGVAGGKRLTIFFAVEGVDQSMHEVYRQNTFLKKILDNMDTIKHTTAKIVSQTLVWKHNEDHLKDIESMCALHGATKHLIMATDRFGNTKEVKFTNNGKQGVLRKTGVNFNDDEFVVKSRRRFVRDTKILNNNDVKLINKIKAEKKKLNIVCEWGIKDKIVINPDGQVFPCCFFCNGYFQSKFDKEYSNTFLNHPVMVEYRDNEWDMNIFNNDLLDIVKNKWFKETLPNSWHTLNPVNQCSKYCGKVNKSYERI